jgi:hypothetical protein
MEALFRLPGAVGRDPEVATWLARQPAALGDIARRWFDYVRSQGDDVRELMHDGCPTACVGGAAFAYVNVFKAHVNVGFFHGADLDDPAGLLEGKGRRMRHVKLRPEMPMDEAALASLIDLAYADVKWRLAADSRRNEPA